MVTPMYVRASVAAAALIVASASVASAQTPPSNPTLADLINGPITSITVGDKLFSNFSYTPTGNMPSAADVNVVPLIETNPDLWGISFTGAFQDVPLNGASVATISYLVTVTDPLRVITDAHLRGNTAILPPGVGVGYITVSQTFAPDAPESLLIFDYSNPPSTDLVDDTLFASSYSSLNVQTVITAEMTGTFGVASLSVLDELYSQGNIPEPASLGLLACGAAGLFLRRRRS